jgi:hypothetical protein
VVRGAIEPLSMSAMIVILSGAKNLRSRRWNLLSHISIEMWGNRLEDNRRSFTSFSMTPVAGQ